MLRNYLQTAVRNLRKHPASTLISISGLAIGIASCLLIGLYVVHETSYDQHFERADDIHRVAWFGDNPQTRTPHPMAQAMVDELPGVERATSISPIWGPGLTRPEILFQYGDNRFLEGRVLSADSTFFDVFDFEFIHGSPATALTQAGGLVLTKSTARKYFGSETPMGKSLRVNDQFELVVTGVVEDVPETTHFHFDILVSYVTLKLTEDGEYYEWSDFGHFNYVLLDNDADRLDVARRVNDWVGEYVEFSPETARRMAAGEIGFRLQPVTDIHLHSDIRWEIEPTSDASLVYIFSAAALLILLIACVNFINMSIAGSESRAREVGVRKVLGAHRGQLALQFVAQGFLVTLAALVVAVGIVELSLPVLNSFLGFDLYLPYDSPVVLLVLGATLAVVGLLAGGYPALVLSSFRPSSALKGGSGRTGGTGGLGRALIVFQFAASIALVAAMMIVRAQLKHIENRPLGFDSEQVVVVPVESDAVRLGYESLRQTWIDEPAVESVAAVSNIPGGSFNQNPVEWQPGDIRIDAAPWKVDHDFAGTLGVQMVEGRSFSRDRPADLEDAYLLNETAVRSLGMDSALGETITFLDDEARRPGTVIGVVKDFHFKSLHQEIEPMIIELAPESMSYVIVRVSSDSPAQAVGMLRTGWNQVYPDVAFPYRFLDSAMEARYSGDRRTGLLFGVFGSVALALACLGLFGLVALAARGRRKEIGIRKALGARVESIVLLLSREFLLLIGLGFALGVPPAAILMDDWMSGFAYSAGLSPGAFIAAGLIVAAVALSTVAWQALRAAMADPVKSLRYE